LEVSKGHFKDFCASNHAARLGCFNYAGLKKKYCCFYFRRGKEFFSSPPRLAQLWSPTTSFSGFWGVRI